MTRKGKKKQNRPTEVEKSKITPAEARSQPVLDTSKASTSSEGQHASAQSKAGETAWRQPVTKPPEASTSSKSPPASAWSQASKKSWSQPASETSKASTSSVDQPVSASSKGGKGAWGQSDPKTSKAPKSYQGQTTASARPEAGETACRQLASQTSKMSISSEGQSASAGELQEKKIQTQSAWKTPAQGSDGRADERHQPSKKSSGAPKQTGQSRRAPAEVQAERSSSTEIASTESEQLPLVFKKPGTLARKTIHVYSNHFGLDLSQVHEAYFYDVTIEEFKKESEKKDKKDETDTSKSKGSRKVGRKIQHQVMQAFINKHFKGRFPSFDGGKILYASKPLENKTDTNIVLRNDFGKEKTFQVTIQFVKTLNLKPEVVDSRFPPLLSQEAKQCIDIILRSAQRFQFTPVGSSFFTKPERLMNLGGVMEMHYGFYQSVVMGSKPLLNFHLVHKAFLRHINVLDAMVEILDWKDLRFRDKPKYSYRSLENMNKYQLATVNEFLENIKVSYQVPGLSRTLYKVNGLAGTPINEKVGGITIQEYFKRTKNYSIHYPEIPLLDVGREKGKIKIPAELCYIEANQVAKMMDDRQTSNMIKFSATSTKEHRDNTMLRFEEAHYNESKYAEEFKIKVKPNFETTPARVLPAPAIQYRDGTADVKRGEWNNRIFLEPKTIGKWALFSVDKYIVRNQLELLSKELDRASKQCGLNFERGPDYPQFRNDVPPFKLKAELEIFFKKLRQERYDIIFVVIPVDKTSYSYVKCAAEITAGCLTQCIQSKTIKSQLGSFKIGKTVANILLKVNAKLAGKNHTFAPHSVPKVLKEEPLFMLLGADVTHPKRTNDSENAMPSVASIIASHDYTGFQYNPCIRLQKNDKKTSKVQEIILDLKNVVKEQLIFYSKKNKGQFPKRIFYFRDGVSEGQFPQVKEKELKAIQSACREVSSEKKTCNPKVAFLVVQKRHHTRLFPVNDRDSEDQGRPDKPGSGNYNVPAGTCVDTNIVDPTMQNFYLVSHASIKGVARPTKYCTVYDELNLTNDEIQELTYYLCHMFARCNRSVSYPAPTYYAHLGALRGKAYILPSLNNATFDINNLDDEMKKIQTQSSIVQANPMFFI